MSRNIFLHFEYGVSLTRDTQISCVTEMQHAAVINKCRDATVFVKLWNTSWNS